MFVDIEIVGLPFADIVYLSELNFDLFRGKCDRVEIASEEDERDGVIGLSGDKSLGGGEGDIDGFVEGESRE